LLQKTFKRQSIITNVTRVLNEAILQISHSVKESVIESRRHFKTKNLLQMGDFKKDGMKFVYLG